MFDILTKTDRQIDIYLTNCSDEEREQWRNVAWTIDAWFMDQEYSKRDHIIDLDENKVYFEGAM